ncbi:Eco57I restriction-modification methylase domain-containing protein [Microbacterium fluvii]|uniref:site-specific DNA-methyltransferase (adenine-specific) n=1 Tax=Microbacterium fluvii TaxID=415215 RepID=A0ABW2HEE6_9MICO|nr:Eco57I restriction-modification methylase domain-containing protein [Microbacterium fluvii]MCU4673137.1 Eco57I restriction-modification methylase domain-containing protein [Microbacterium fluvii]
MLDTLEAAWAEANGGKVIWADPNVTFLDPFTKSGVFLREIVSRLTHGLESVIPDLQQRVDHILTKQVFGIGITQLTALLARRSVYCSKDATGPHSVAKGFDRDWGNIWFERTEHTWAGDKCAYCGAARAIQERGDELETHAYAFIHTTDPRALLATMFGADVQFDVIIGNPPYQLDDGGHNNSAAPIYQHFVENGFALEPRFVVLVTPSRWFAGGRGLDKFRDRMLHSHRIRQLVDFPKLYDGFPGVKIRGGVSYFLWDRDNEGPCTIQTMWDNVPLGAPATRDLDAYDVLVRRNEAVSILEKVRARHERTLDKRVSAGKPFGLRTFFHGKPSKDGLADPVMLFGSQKISWIERSEVEQHGAWVDQWKVLMTAVQGTSAAVETKFLSRPIVAGPGTACSETYLVAGRFEDEATATRYADYLRSRFLRFLVSLRKSTQHANRDVYSFVPDLPLDEDWTDEKLYARYGLTEDEIAFIESQVAPHDA